MIDSKFSKLKSYENVWRKARRICVMIMGDESVGFMCAIGHWPHFRAIIYHVQRMRLKGVCLKYGESLNTSMVLLYAKVPSVLLSTVLRETLEVL